MFSIICGAALIAISSASCTRNGDVHPLVNRFDGGSMITIVITTLFTFGIVLVAANFIG
jgi:hypothetical protein